MRITSSNYAACIARIAARGSIGPEEARALLEETAEAGERQRQSGVEDPIATAAWQLARDLTQRAARNRADALLNATKRQARITEATASGDINDARHKLDSRLFWTAGTAPNENVQTLARGLHNEWASTMHAQLKQKGLLQAAANPQNFRDIAIAIAQKKGLMIDYPTVAKAFRDIADIIQPAQEAIRVRLNSEGSHIADAHDWIASTAHDDYLMRRGGRGQSPAKTFDEAFARWRAVVEPRFKPFEPIVAREGETEAEATTRFWRSIFEAKITGVHMGMGETLTPGGALRGGAAGRYELSGGNIARKLSEGRVIQPNSASAWAEYMQLYGRSTNWYSLMAHAAETGSRKAALMHFFGTNPAANLKLIVRRIAEQYRSKDPDGVAAFLKAAEGGLFQPGLEQVMARLDGSANAIQSDLFHKIGTTARAFYDMVYLGFVAGTHAGSLVSTFPSEARMHGINSFVALGRMMKGMVPEGLSAADRADRLAALQAYGDGVSRYGQDAFAHGRNFPGYIAAAHNRFMQATGLPYIFDHARWGMREMLANNLARNLTKDFGDLNPRLQMVLRRYGIEEAEWSTLKAAGPDIRAPNGLEYLTPRAALGTPLGRELADRLAMYYQDAADHATVTAGVREQAMLRRNLKPGSWQDELLQSLLQFKTWPVAAAHQVLGREIYGNLTRGRAALGVGAVVALSMLGGYLRMTARDLAYGQEPRMPMGGADAVKLALAALAQGGGLGIFGDFLFGEANRMGSSRAQTLGGPVVSDLGALFDIYNRWLSSIGTTQKGDVWPELARWGINHIPGLNLFYVKGAADYLFLYHVYEALHPGWWERTNRRMQKEQGRTMSGYVPGAGVPWGLPYLYLQSHGVPVGGVFAGAR